MSFFFLKRVAWANPAWNADCHMELSYDCHMIVIWKSPRKTSSVAPRLELGLSCGSFRLSYGCHMEISKENIVGCSCRLNKHIDTSIHVQQLFLLPFVVSRGDVALSYVALRLCWLSAHRFQASSQSLAQRLNFHETATESYAKPTLANVVRHSIRSVVSGY